MNVQNCAKCVHLMRSFLIPLFAKWSLIPENQHWFTSEFDCQGTVSETLKSLSGRRGIVVASVCRFVRSLTWPWPHGNLSHIWAEIATHASWETHVWCKKWRSLTLTSKVILDILIQSSGKNWLLRALTCTGFELQAQNLHQICILGFSQLVLKTGVVDPDLQWYFRTCLLRLFEKHFSTSLSYTDLGWTRGIYTSERAFVCSIFVILLLFSETLKKQNPFLQFHFSTSYHQLHHEKTPRSGDLKMMRCV